MNETPDTIARIAQDILMGNLFDPHAAEPPRDMAQAYADQDELNAYLLDNGHRTGLAGYKIAVNAQAQMAQFGVQEPASGRVYADQTSQTPARRRVSDYTSFFFEPEIAAILGAPIEVTGQGVSREQVVEAIDRFVPALELLDLRFVRLPSVHLPDVVAQNITNAGAVIGGPGVAPSDLDTDTVATTVSVSGQQEVEVVGAAPQDPVEAVHWLANHLAGRGLSLLAGQIVLCGTHIPMRQVEGPAEIAVTMSGLGRVDLSLTET